ncbi:MAG: tRNA (guanosine(46)-N7)-methyltransferase TrmB [Verrucomicrobiae bacterium]|nr:tRNA (guanosine(46)-N7)-methyltransferase TrmB [Verrucomicrobiae bacterium]
MNPQPVPTPAWLDPTCPRLFYPITNLIERLDWSRLFLTPQPVEVELGSGDGSFLAHYARLHPDRNFLGVERLLGRARKLERKALRAGLTNLRIIRLEAGYLTEYLLPAGTVTVFHIYFPDPWPKKKHHKNRLINARFVRLLGQALQPGGRVHLRTDDAGYFQWMQEAFATHPGFQPQTPPPELLALKTDFELEFNQRGIPTLALSYQWQGEKSA